MLTPYQLSIFLPAAFIVAISPGANNILSLSHGALAGFYPTVFSLAGRFLAFSLMLLPVAAGLGAVITTSEVIFLTMKWIGVCYLAYIGFSMWFSRFHYDPIDTSRGFDGISLAKEEFIVAMTNSEGSAAVYGFPSPVRFSRSSLFPTIADVGWYLHSSRIPGCVHLCGIRFDIQNFKPIPIAQPCRQQNRRRHDAGCSDCACDRPDR